MRHSGPTNLMSPISVYSVVVLTFSYQKMFEQINYLLNPRLWFISDSLLAIRDFASIASPLGASLSALPPYLMKPFSCAALMANSEYFTELGDTPPTENRYPDHPIDQSNDNNFGDHPPFPTENDDNPPSSPPSKPEVPVVPDRDTDRAGHRQPSIRFYGTVRTVSTTVPSEPQNPLGTVRVMVWVAPVSTVNNTAVDGT